MDHEERAIHCSYFRRNGYCAKATSAYRSLGGDLIGANYWWYCCQRRTTFWGVRHCDTITNSPTSMKGCLGLGITAWKREYYDAPDKDGNEWGLSVNLPIWVRLRCFKNNKVAIASGGFTDGCTGDDQKLVEIY